MPEKTALLKNVANEDVAKILNTLAIIGDKKSISFEIMSDLRKRVDLCELAFGLSEQNSKRSLSSEKIQSITELIAINGKPNGVCSISIELSKNDDWFISVGENRFQAGKNLLTVNVAKVKDLVDLKNQLNRFFDEKSWVLVG